jgi:hypothetical protein
VSIDARDVRTFIEKPAKALNTEDAQPRHNDEDEHEHHQALMVAKEIEHA